MSAIAWGKLSRTMTRREEDALLVPGDLIDAPAFTDLLNVKCEVGKWILFRDLKTTGRLFEVLPAGVEGRPDATIAEYHKRLVTALSDSIPPGEGWIVQFFVEDEKDLAPLLTKIMHYSRHRDEAFSKDWFERLDQHFKQVAQPQGLFIDEKVTGGAWRGRFRRAHVCLWRETSSGGEDFEDIDQVAEKMTRAFEQAQVRLRDRSPADLYAWLTRWFVPGDESEKLLRERPWSGAGHGGLEFVEDGPGDIARAALHDGLPRSDAETGRWYFRGAPSQFLVLKGLREEPPIGALTAELAGGGEQRQVLWDLMPAGSAFSLTLSFESQESVRVAIDRALHNSIGDRADAINQRAAATEAMDGIAQGNAIVRALAGVYVRGEDDAQLERHVAQAASVLGSFSLQVVPARHNPIAQDTWLRALPFNFDSRHDARPYIRQANLTFVDHAARIAPVFGRSTGTGNSGVCFWNRGAEPLTFDPLGVDRQRNAHALLLGPTGSGKTALLIYTLLHMLAIHRPRLYLVSTLPTFGLFAQHLERLGLSVNHVRVGDAEKEVSLPPFGDAYRLLDEEDEQSGASDLIAELEARAVLMSTNADPREEQRMRLADKQLLREAIRHAAKTCKERGAECVLITDVVEAMRAMADNEQSALSETDIANLRERAVAMARFCDGLAGRVFNRPGALWPDVDVTIFELGPLAGDEHKAAMATAITSLFSQINSKVQAEQYDERQTITVIDEAHLLLQSPLTAPYLNKIAAQWRTFGAWLWVATQSLAQFPETAKELLAQPEWWLCLSMDKQEVDSIARFKELSDEQKSLLLAAKKSPGQFTEGAVISDSVMTLFRSVVPALALALAQTEKHEKAARANVMREHQCSEIEAVDKVAEQIIKQRGGAS